MLGITKDIEPLTTFRRRSGDFMKQLKKSKRPVVLTVKGKAAAIVQDAEAYQRLLDIAARADAEEGIRQSLEDAKKGKARPATQRWGFECPIFPTYKSGSLNSSSTWPAPTS